MSDLKMITFRATPEIATILDANRLVGETFTEMMFRLIRKANEATEDDMMFATMESTAIDGNTAVIPMEQLLKSYVRELSDAIELAFDDEERKQEKIKVVEKYRALGVAKEDLKRLWKSNGN